MNPPAELVFDLDGTISDPLVGLHRSVNFALAAHGMESVDRGIVAACVGPPLDEAFRALTPGVVDEQVLSLVAKYRERYAEVGFTENTIYPGISDVFATLAGSGLALGVCTSKRTDFAEKILDRFGIRQHFVFVDGGDIGVAKCQQLAALLAKKRVHPNARMFGDRAVDMLAAKANGLFPVGVLWGYGSKNELREAGAGILLSDPAELSRFQAAA